MSNRRIWFKADWQPGDFKWPDFKGVANTMYSYTYWFMNSLSDYFYTEDTYKDINNDGLYLKYLGIMGAEIDDEIIPMVEYVTDLIDTHKTDSIFINHLSETLGSPPNITFTEEDYRNLLKYVIAIYKIKGTKKSYELFFSLLGYDIELIELPPNNIINQYDDEGLYDDEPRLIYDSDSCVWCSEYDIIIYPRFEHIRLTRDILDRLKRAVEFTEPINAKLRYIKVGVSIEEDLKVRINEVLGEQPEYIFMYDINRNHDEDEIYDEYIAERDIAKIINVKFSQDVTNTSNGSNFRGLLTFDSDDNIPMILVRKSLTLTLLANNGSQIQSIQLPLESVVSNIPGDNYSFNVNVVRNILTNQEVKYYKYELGLELAGGIRTYRKTYYQAGVQSYETSFDLYFN